MFNMNISAYLTCEGRNKIYYHSDTEKTENCVIHFAILLTFKQTFSVSGP